MLSFLPYYDDQGQFPGTPFVCGSLLSLRDYLTARPRSRGWRWLVGGPPDRDPDHSQLPVSLLFADRELRVGELCADTPEELQAFASQLPLHVESKLKRPLLARMIWPKFKADHRVEDCVDPAFLCHQCQPVACWAQEHRDDIERLRQHVGPTDSNTPDRAARLAAHRTWWNVDREGNVT